MKKKIPVLYIHGGMTFKNRHDYLHFLKHRPVRIENRIKWSGDYLGKRLGDRFQVIRPRMPLQDNAQYKEWAIHFERYLAQLKNNFILIGESLGGVFLAKYLSEHKFSRKISAVYLVCPPFDNSLPTEDLVGGFTLKSDLSLLDKNVKRLHLLFSKNDDVVPVTHAKKYAAKLPSAKIIVYRHIKGHFNISQFPEVVKMIKRDVEMAKHD